MEAIKSIAIQVPMIIASLIFVTSAVLKTGKARAIRLSTLEGLCRHLNCQPGDILEYQDDTDSTQEE